MQQYNKWLLIPVLWYIASCSSSTATESSSVSYREYPIISLNKIDTLLDLQYVSDIQARKNVEIHARVPGILEKIYVDEGQTVKKGQLLFLINDAELQIELSRAKAAYSSAVAEAKVAKVVVEQVKILFDKNIVAVNELDLAIAKHQALEAKATEALEEKNAVEKRISFCKVVSPFDGIIDRIPMKEGSLVINGSLLTTVSDLQEVYAYFSIPESEYFQISQKSGLEKIEKIQLVLPDGSVYPYPGSIEPAESEIDKNTGSIAFRARFPNKSNLIKHGASGKLIISQMIEDVILIPQKAVMEIQDKNYVYVLDENNAVVMKNIQPSQRLSNFYIIKDGLQENQKVVCEGIRTIREGEIITPVETSL